MTSAQLVVQAILLDGLKITEASLVFSISRNTIRLWLKRERETGDFQALPNQPPGNGHKITDWEKFGEFVKANGDQTQAQMVELWPGEISERTISRGLKKIGYTRKKKRMVIRSAMRLNGQGKSISNRLDTRIRSI